VQLRGRVNDEAFAQTTTKLCQGAFSAPTGLHRHAWSMICPRRLGEAACWPDWKGWVSQTAPCRVTPETLAFDRQYRHPDASTELAALLAGKLGEGRGPFDVNADDLQKQLDPVLGLPPR
jgi:OOP family OmpA-OmpF porin